MSASRDGCFFWRRDYKSGRVTPITRDEYFDAVNAAVAAAAISAPAEDGDPHRSESTSSDAT